MRLIDANALKKAINTEFKGHLLYFPIAFKDLIDNAPTVEPERPHGKWITRHKQNSFGQDVVCFECNKCHKYTLPLISTMITEPLAVCPNCGADMRGDNNG